MIAYYKQLVARVSEAEALRSYTVIQCSVIFYIKALEWSNVPSLNPFNGILVSGFFRESLKCPRMPLVRRGFLFWFHLYRYRCLFGQPRLLITMLSKTHFLMRMPLYASSSTIALFSPPNFIVAPRRVPCFLPFFISVSFVSFRLNEKIRSKQVRSTGWRGCRALSSNCRSIGGRERLLWIAKETEGLRLIRRRRARHWWAIFARFCSCCVGVMTHPTLHRWTTRACFKASLLHTTSVSSLVITAYHVILFAIKLNYINNH